MLTSARADSSLISVMTLICLSIYWLTGERTASDVSLCPLSWKYCKIVRLHFHYCFFSPHWEFFVVMLFPIFAQLSYLQQPNLNYLNFCYKRQDFPVILSLNLTCR